MKFVNKFNLPEAYVRAVKNDPYDRGNTYSPTLLNSPARAAALIDKHFNELEVDVISRVAALLGQGTHALLERAARPGVDIVEERYCAEVVVDGKTHTLSAQIDLYEGDTKTLSDWKTTKAFAFTSKAGGGLKPEWVSQMNIQKYVAMLNGLDVRKIQIIGFLKDWAKREAVKAGYPQAEVVAVELPIWTSQETEEFIKERIRAHEAAKVKLPLCSKEETWGGNRCKGYCDAAQVCEQFKQMSKTGIFPKDEVL